MIYLLKTLIVIDVLMAVGLVVFRWALVPRHRGLVSGKLAALALLTPAVALFCGNVYLFCLYLVVVVAFASRRRAELAGTYLFLLPLMPMLTVETGVGGIYLLTVSAATAMGLGALIGFMTTGGRAATLPRYDVAMWLLVILFVFIYNRNGNPTVLLRGFTTYVLAFAGPYLLVSRAARNADEIERVLLRLCLGATLVAVTACFQARFRWVLFEAYYQALHVNVPITSASLALRAGLLRTGGSMIDYSASGLFLAAIVTLLPLLRRYFRPLGFWVVLLVVIAGLVVTQSRGAWVAAIAGLVIVGAQRGRWARVVLTVGAAAAAQVAIRIVGESSRLAQIAGQTDAANGTVDYRQRLLTRGMEQIRGHPLFGQTPEQLVDNLPDLRQGEHIVDFVNAHLFVAMTAGVPLFALWAGVWAMPVIEGWQRRRGAHAHLAAVPTAIIVPAMVALTFTSFIDRNLTWPIVALGLTASCLTINRRPARPDTRLDTRPGTRLDTGPDAFAAAALPAPLPDPSPSPR